MPSYLLMMQMHMRFGTSKIISQVLPDPYRQDLAFRLLKAVSRRPKDRIKANMPFANLHED